MRSNTIGELAALLGLPYRVNHIPEWKKEGTERAPNRPKKIRPGEAPEKDTVHETANPRRGADAHMHELYVRAPNWGGLSQTSYHHVVDDKEAIELLPWQEVAYHGGTPASNTTWLGTELCVNVDGDWNKTLDNAAKLFACKAVKFEKPVSWIVQHNASYGKDCPFKLRHTPGGWQMFLAKVGDYIGVLLALLDPATDPLPGVTVPQFKAFYQSESKALQYWGLPLGASKQERLSDGNVYTVQYFERARFELHDGKVQLGLLGVEVLSS